MSDLAPNAALLLIDLPQAIDDPDRHRRNTPGAERAIARLLAAWRASGRPVVHVQHLATEPGSPDRRGQPGRDFAPEVRPLAGEIVVQKSGGSAFAETGLAALLRDQGIVSLVIVGAGNHNGVEDTAHVAVALGFAARVVSDATWSVERTDLGGRLWRAEELHALSLARLAGEGASVATAEEVLGTIELRAAS